MAVDLVGIEDGVDLGDESTLDGAALSGVGVVAALGGDPLDDIGRSFALADLSACLLVLVERGVVGGRETSFDGIEE